MSLETYVPPYPLSESVVMMWHWEDYAPEHPYERILPIGLEEITFNLSDGVFSVHKPLSESHHNQYSQGMFVGCHSEYFVIDTNKPTTLFSVLFKSGAARHFIDSALKEHHNCIRSIGDVWGQEADTLYNQLMESYTASVRFMIMEQFLLDKLNRTKERHHAIHHALNVFTQAAPDYRIAELQDDVALSPPRFIQLFRDDVGITPKLYSRLQRFHRVLDTAASSLHHNWTEIALTCGYYDQSHMINEFQKFAGMPPSAYVPQSLEHNKNLPYFDVS